MSFGGGSQGTIRYQLIIDDAQANQKLGTFKNSLTQLAPATANVNREMGALANNFKGTTGGLTQQNTLIGQMTQQHKSLGTQIKDTSARFSGLAIGISATASSALSLAAGFRDYNDAQIAVERVTRKLSLAHEALTKAQDKLNALQSKGIKSGKDYQQAQLDVQQAQQQVDIQTQLLGESQERLFDSQTQFVVSIVPTVIGAFGTMGAAIKAFSGPDGVSGATSALGGLRTAITGMGGMSKFLMFAGPIGLAVTAAILLISKLEELKKTVSDAYHEIGLKTIDTPFLTNAKKAVDELNASFNDTNEILKRTGPKSVLDLNFGAKEALQTFKSLGGSIDKTGHAVQTLTDRNIELQPAFKKNGETAATWIHSMEIYLEKSNGAADILGKLKKANFDDATAKKIAAAAYEDYYNKLKAGEPLLKAATKATNDTTAAQKSLGVQLVFNTSQWANTSAEVEDVTGSYNDLLIPSKTLSGQLLKNQQTTSGVSDEYQRMTTILAKMPKQHFDNARAFDAEQMKARQAVEAQNLYNQSLINSIKNMETTNDKIVQQEQSWDTLGGTLINDLKFMDQMDKANVDQAKTLSDAAKAWDTFKASAVDAVNKAFGADPQKQIDKMFSKLKKFAPKDLQVFIDMRVKKEALKELASTAIAGLEDYMTTDANADKVGKTIIKMINSGVKNKKDKAAAKPIIDYINWAISQPNTKMLLDKLGQELQNGNPIQIPSELSFQSTAGGSNSAENEQNGVDAAFITKHYLKVTRANPVLIPAALEFDPTFGQPQGPQGEGGTNEKGQPVDRKGNVITGGGGAGPAVQAQKLQTALANLATQGSNSLGILAKNSSLAMNGMSKNFKVGEVASQKLQTGIANLAKQGSNSLGILAKTSSSDMNGMKKNLSVGEVAAQKLQTGLANLDNQGSKSLNELAKASSKAMNGLIHNVQAAQKAVISLIKSIGNLHSKTITIKANVSGPVRLAQSGMHETLASDTMILAHAGERVDIGHGGGSGGGSGGSSTGGNANGMIVVNLTNVNSDRETTRVFRRKLGEHQFRFGPR